MTQPPDPDASGSGQDATQPPPAQSFPPAPPAFPQAPPVPEDYGYGQYAEPVPAGMFYDQESGLVLPQGVRLASVARRVGAFFLSILLVIVTLGIGYIVWGVIVWANGQTPALQVLGMRCWVPDTRSVAGWWRMALREIVGGFLEHILGLITEIASFVLMVVGRERKAIHDWVAGTVVLRDPDKVLLR